MLNDDRVGVVSHEEAVQLALAYIDKAFGNPEKEGRRGGGLKRKPLDTRTLRWCAKQARLAAAEELEHPGRDGPDSWQRHAAGELKAVALRFEREVRAITKGKR